MSAQHFASHRPINVINHRPGTVNSRRGSPALHDDVIDAAFPAATVHGGMPPASQLDFVELMRRVLRRRWLIGLLTFAMTCLAAALVSVLPERYAATAQVMIDDRPAPVVDTTGAPAVLTFGKELIQSEIEVLRSRRLAKLAVNQLGLLQYPYFNAALEPDQPTSPLMAAVEPFLSQAKALVAGPQADEFDDKEKNLRKAADALLASIDVVPEGQSRVINVTVETDSPTLSTNLANKIVDLYIEDKIQAKTFQSQRASIWLRERLDELRPILEESERAVDDYRRQAGIVEGQQAEVISQQLSEVNTLLVIAQAERTKADARLKQVQDLIDAPEQIDSIPEVLSSPVVQNLLGESAKLSGQIAELSSEYGPNHPRVLGIRAEINGLEASIAVQVKQVVQSLKDQSETAALREQTLSARLESLKGEASDLRAKEIGLRGLEREAEADREIFERILKRYRETSTEAEAAIEPDARLVSVADEPTNPSFPKKKLTVLIAICGSFGLSVLLALLLEHFDLGFRSSEQVARITGLKTLALVPAIESIDKGLFGRSRARRASPSEYVIDQPGSAFGESLRGVHTALTSGGDGAFPRTVMLTSALVNEGKSTTALSLGHLLAMHGEKVIVVDADIRRPNVAKQLGLPSSPGLIEVINEECRLEDAINQSQRSGLYALAAGGPALSPQALFNAPTLRTAVLDRLTTMFDLVIVDTPPVLAVSDAKLLCRLVDKTIFMVRWGKTKSESVALALQQLRDSGADIAGVVLTRVDVRKNATYGYGDSAYHQKENMAYYSHG